MHWYLLREKSARHYSSNSTRECALLKERERTGNSGIIDRMRDVITTVCRRARNTVGLLFVAQQQPSLFNYQEQTDLGYSAKKVDCIPGMSTSSLRSAFYTPANYPLPRTFLPQFSPLFTRWHSRVPHFRFLPTLLPPMQPIFNRSEVSQQSCVNAVFPYVSMTTKWTITNIMHLHHDIESQTT